jgi:DNA-directed RNA polymerase specialized sigma24 family protein
MTWRIISGIARLKGHEGYRGADDRGPVPRTGARVVPVRLLLTGDLTTAEDLVQDAFLGLHRHRGTAQDPTKVQRTS